MPRFFFHTHDQRFFPDDAGAELPDLAAAQVHAVIVLGEILKEKPRDFWSQGQASLTVTDADGLALFRLDLVAAMAPAA